MKIGIIGGGVMGLSLAYHLSQANHEVIIYEKNQQLGGLATYHDFGAFYWDRYYHVILPTDGPLINFIKSIGLGEKLEWETTKTGFYVDGEYYPLNDAFDFIKFPPLNLWNKFRLGLAILYASRIKDWKKLEKIKVEDWLIKVSGTQTYNKIWKPLLLAKLGENYKRVSAVFIWSYIARLYGARDSSARKEQMGYVSGGYKTVIDKLTEIIQEGNGKIYSNCTVLSIQPSSEDRLKVETTNDTEEFEKVIFTSPVNVLQKVVSGKLIDIEYAGKDVEYSGVVCLALVTKKEISPYYTLNITDNSIAYTAVIGMSSVVSIDETGGYYLTYFPKYIHSNDPFLKKPDNEIRELFMGSIKKMYPQITDEDIVGVHINREFRVQPLQVLNYSTIIPRVSTRHPGFYILNTSQFVNNTLNNNAVIQAVNNFIENENI